ncbi:MAG: hypothetical protein K0V04_19355 [Deltaproteobacteria bacterium]|nr:hypothetical protein [Deltaproteobacteria bacterium]
MADDTELSDLIAQADAAPHDAQRVLLLEEAVRLADAAQDEATAVSLRGTLISAAIDAGLPDRALVAFTWLRNAERREDPDGAASAEQLWRFKWIAEEIPLFLGVTREQLQAFFADMRREYDRAAQSSRPLFQQQMLTAMHLGAPAADVEALYVQWQSGLLDTGADCAACERHTMVEYQLYVHGVDVALDTARPILDETLSCWQVPHRTVGALLLPLFDDGQVELARDLHMELYERSRGRGDLVLSIGHHLELCALLGELERGRQGIERHLRMALENAAALRRLPLLMGAHAVLRQLARVGRPVRLRLPLVPLLSTESSMSSMGPALRRALEAGLSQTEATGEAEFDAGALAQGLIDEVRSLVAQADARSGWSYYAEQLERYERRHADPDAPRS